MGDRLAILVVEDDLDLREALGDTLDLSGYVVRYAENGKEALKQIKSGEIGMVLTDVQMPIMDGDSLLNHIKRYYPFMPVVLMTAYGTIQKAVESLKKGASDYLVKPFEASVLLEVVSRLLPEETFSDEVIAVDPITKKLLNLAQRVAQSNATVLLTGPSGSGKEVFAREIHRRSLRSSRPFVAINCAAIPENMLEAMLFGYEKGAFTGAYEGRPGKFEQAQDGTLLLDEIAEMPLALQAKLLRVLQEGEVERLGGKKIIQLDVRVIASTNQSLVQLVQEGRFREDLYYRLNVFPMGLPRLKDRSGDILPLAEKFIQHHSGLSMSLSFEARRKLQDYSWPGNIRELDNVIQRALILSFGDVIQAEQILFEAETVENLAKLDDSLTEPIEQTTDLEDNLKKKEMTVILTVLKQVNGNRALAAERLGISARTLRYKLARMRDSGVELPA